MRRQTALCKRVIMTPRMADPGTSEETKPAEEIPDKLYFRIGEVSRLAGIKPYVLRFWESEFGGLGPKKSGTGHRLYRRKDVEMVLEIKRLLYEKRFTIEGARKILADKHRSDQGKTMRAQSGTFATAAVQQCAASGRDSKRTTGDFEDPEVRQRPSGENAVVHVAGDVGEPEIAAGIFVGELRVIEAEQGQHGRVEIVDVHAVFRRMVAEVIRRSVGEAGLHAAARHEERIAVRVVVAAVAAFGNRGAAELTGPDHQRVFQHARAPSRSFSSPAIGLSTSAAFSLCFSNRSEC